MVVKNYLGQKYKTMYKIINFLTAFIVFFFLCVKIHATEDENRIAILVNDNVITNYDIEQRVKIFAIMNQLLITPENSGIITNKIVDELIDNILKTEKIEEYKIAVEEKDLKNYESQYFANRGIGKEDFFKMMKINEINQKQFYDVLYNDIAWQILISRLYYRITSVSDEEIDELLSNDPNITRELAEKLIMDKQLALKSSKMLRDLRSEATIEYK